MRRRLVVWGFILIALIALGAVLVQRTLALRECRACATGWRWTSSRSCAM